MEQHIKNARAAIDANIGASGNERVRIPPVAITSMARSGKTTLLQTLFNTLLSEKKYNPIMVTFNGNGGFQARKGEKDIDTFVRWVSKSLLSPRDHPVGEWYMWPWPFSAFSAYRRKKDLLKYLSKSKKPIVLLVDELNIVAPDMSEDLSLLLRRRFLDQRDRYLCFTSHRFVEVELKATSPRKTHIVEVPRTQVSRHLNDALPLSATATITPAQAALCLGSVGLCVSIYGRQFPLEHYFTTKLQLVQPPIQDSEYPALLQFFLTEFCTGFSCHIRATSFHLFTTRLHDLRVVWPLCYAKEFLSMVNSTNLCEIIDHARNVTKLPTVTRSGLVWEYIARVAIGVVATCAKFRLLNVFEKIVIGPLDFICADVRFVSLPVDLLQFEKIQVWLEEKMTNCTAYPILIVATPSDAQFHIFDSITCFKEHSNSQSHFTGQQMKEGNGYPKHDAPAPFSGILLRGRARDKSYGPRTRRGWEYLSNGQIKKFLPCSLEPLMPSEWK